MELRFDYDIANWEIFVRKHKDGNVFMLPKMCQVYEAHPGYRVIRIFAIEGDEIKGIIIGFLLKEPGLLSFFSSRVIVMGGPVAKEGSDEILHRLVSEFAKITRRHSIYTQVRCFEQQFNIEGIYKEQGFIHEDHLEIVVDISLPEEDLWKGLHTKRRNEIRKAQRSGTYVREILDDIYVRESFSILREVYQSRRIPFPGENFFMDAWKILGGEGILRVFGAFSNDRLIGTMLILCFNNKLYDWYAGSRQKYNSMHPNDILPWEVFLWGKENGYKQFEFGGAGHPLKSYGVREYKKKFGGEMVNFGRFTRINKPLLYNVSKYGYKLWRKIRSGNIFGRG